MELLRATVAAHPKFDGENVLQPVTAELPSDLAPALRSNL